VGEGFKDLLSCLGPGERLGILVPVLDPRADVGFEGLDVLVGPAADHLVGQEAEPALDLVDPGAAGGGEVHVKAWVLGQPGPDRGYEEQTHQQ
jgi:hypothetical protein